MLYGSETYAKEKQKCRTEAFGMRCYRRVLNINWTNMVTNEEVLERMSERGTQLWIRVSRKERMNGLEDVH